MTLNALGAIAFNLENIARHLDCDVSMPSQGSLGKITNAGIPLSVIQFDGRTGHSKIRRPPSRYKAFNTSGICPS